MRQIFSRFYFPDRENSAEAAGFTRFADRAGRRVFPPASSCSSRRRRRRRATTTWFPPAISYSDGGCAWILTEYGRRVFFFSDGGGIISVPFSGDIEAAATAGCVQGRRSKAGRILVRRFRWRPIIFQEGLEGCLGLRFGDPVEAAPSADRGGSGSCNNKLVGAQHFIVPGFHNTPIDDTGHGTHVAGIAVGSPVYNVDLNGLARGTASGMAPSAHLAVYKVCRKNGCPDSFSLKGIEKAIRDGVDVIQISNGEPAEFQLSGNIKGSFRALQNGILTICSAQNEGPTPSLISNDAPWILTVGAASTGRRNTAVLKLGNGMVFKGESSNQPDPSSNIVDVPLLYPGVIRTDQKLACQNGSMTGLNVTGKIVLCGIGFNDPVEKSKLVKEAGGAGIIVMNQVWNGDTLWSYSFGVPGIHVTNKDALKIVDYFTVDKNPTASITFKGTEFGVRPSPSIATFSSRGPSLYNGGILKPDVVAPGVDILSAWPFDAGDSSVKLDDAFNFESGTSMAAPHVSGIAALLKKMHPNWTPAMIKSALMTTAYTEDRDKNRITDNASNSGAPANAFAIGAGHVNPSAAEDPGLVYDTRVEDYLSYLCGLKGMTPIKIITITNGAGTCFNRKSMPTEELNYPSIQISMGSGGKNKMVPRTVTNVGKAKSTYSVTVVEPKGVTVDVNPQTLTFDSVGEAKNFTVEISLTGSPPAKDVWEGRLVWASGKYQVTSPIVIID